MKISIITPSFPYPRRGLLKGAERYVEHLAINLKEIGNNVKIVTTYWNGGKRYDDFNGISILRILDSKALIGKLGSIFFFNHVTFAFNLYRKKNFNFIDDSEVVILAMAIPFTRFFKIKKKVVISIFYHREILRTFLDYITYPFLHLLEQLQYKMHKHVITKSETSKNALLTHYGLNMRNITVISDGIDTNKFNPTNKKEFIREKYGNKILLYSGLMTTRKRVSVLLKALPLVIQEIPDVQLILAGKGPYLKDYKKLSNSLGLEKNSTFLGFVDDQKLRELYASVDIFVFPSELEGFGQVLLEAMASGTPVICANKPPMSLIIRNGGLTFEVNNSRDLAGKIIRLFNNPEEMFKLGSNGIREAKKYEWKKIAKIYFETIKEINKSYLK
ncbi:MAG: glycosyltransferase family 4 protein [Promethearchaeota archaeon]